MPKNITRRDNSLTLIGTVTSPVSEANRKALLVRRIVDLAFKAIAPAAPAGDFPNHFVLEAETRKLRTGSLRVASVRDLPAPDLAVTWTGRNPLYALSVICPCFHHAAFGDSAFWTLQRLTLFCTDGSKRKLAKLEQSMVGRGGSRSYEIGDGTNPFTPVGRALTEDYSQGAPTRIWSAIPAEHQAEAERWCKKQPYSAIVSLRGVQVRQVFNSSLLDGDLKWTIPDIEVHKLL